MNQILCDGQKSLSIILPIDSVSVKDSFFHQPDHYKIPVMNYIIPTCEQRKYHWKGNRIHPSQEKGIHSLPIREINQRSRMSIMIMITF